MYLQGNLQTVFDALYQMGVIDPVLEKDWEKAMDKYPQVFYKLKKVINIANSYQNSADDLARRLEKFDIETLEYLAMEVAREYADYHSREQLH